MTKRSPRIEEQVIFSTKCGKQLRRFIAYSVQFQSVILLPRSRKQSVWNNSTLLSRPSLLSTVQRRQCLQRNLISRLIGFANCPMLGQSTSVKISADSLDRAFRPMIHDAMLQIVSQPSSIANSRPGNLPRARFAPTTCFR